MKQINTLEKEFVPFELELRLRYLGCDKFINYTTYDPYPTENKGILYQQAFSWFRKEYNLISWVYKTNIDTYYFSILRKDRYLHDFTVNCVTYEEAQLACLERLIELVEREYETD